MGWDVVLYEHSTTPVDQYVLQYSITWTIDTAKASGRQLKQSHLLAELLFYADQVKYRMADFYLIDFEYCDPAFPDNLYMRVCPRETKQLPTAGPTQR